ncbi:glycosyl transferase family 28 [Sphaerospermopsis reniformis]|uniref:Glycosyl transferase family 28 n=1 Tax=Sphaerospermopsis reniformis TaxID=531300 RepID=A0A479ZV12_9CYAN|nr:glycosyl transferase family 28 [Sphaerospermopsis reniformis]
MVFRKGVNQFREKTLQLTPLSNWQRLYGRLQKVNVPYLYGFSPVVVPKPSTWSERLHITGYWFLEHPANWTPPQDLQEFIAAGSPPVYIGFGSMTGRDPQQMTEIALTALKKTKQRGILVTGSGGIAATDLPETVFKIESVPHDWLFPRMAAIVHHGGAGTSAAALRAGVPSIIIPFFGDQPFWGHCLWQLGVSPEPIPKPALTVDKLAQAITTAVNHTQMRQKAQFIGEQIRLENGVNQAVAAFHQHFPQQQAFLQMI